MGGTYREENGYLADIDKKAEYMFFSSRKTDGGTCGRYRTTQSG